MSKPANWGKLAVGSRVCVEVADGLEPGTVRSAARYSNGAPAAFVVELDDPTAIESHLAGQLVLTDDADAYEPCAEECPDCTTCMA